MSLPARDTPRPFQPPVAQRDIKAEVIYCVGGVISPLMANIALSALTTISTSMAAADATEYQRAKRRRNGKANYKIVRYADDGAPRTQLEVAM